MFDDRHTVPEDGCLFQTKAGKDRTADPAATAFLTINKQLIVGVDFDIPREELKEAV